MSITSPVLITYPAKTCGNRTIVTNIGQDMFLSFIKLPMKQILHLETMHPLQDFIRLFAIYVVTYQHVTHVSILA